MTRERSSASALGFPERAEARAEQSPNGSPWLRLEDMKVAGLHKQTALTDARATDRH